MDGAISIESIGFTLMDGKDGDFTFDLVSLRAVNVLQGEVVGTKEDEKRKEKWRQQFLEESGKGEKKKKGDDDEDAEEIAIDKLIDLRKSSRSK